MNKRKGILLILAGCILLTASLALYSYNQEEDSRAAETSSQVIQRLQEQNVPVSQETAAEEIQIAVPYKPQMQETEPGEELPVTEPEMSVLHIDGNDYIGYLSIPDLNLELPVMDQWDYSRLKKAPCLYYGSVYSNDMVIAAHNYNSHFGRLGSLTLGSSVIFTDAEGVAHQYQVAEIETLMPEAVEPMLNSGYDLSLYTCTYGGASRVTVRCSRM